MCFTLNLKDSSGLVYESSENLLELLSIQESLQVDFCVNLFLYRDYRLLCDELSIGNLVISVYNPKWELNAMKLHYQRKS